MTPKTSASEAAHPLRAKGPPSGDLRQRGAAALGTSLLLALVAAALSLSCDRRVPSSTNDTPPNFVLFLADDQGWTGTSVQMDPENEESKSDFYSTPHLESFASESMRFSNAYAASPNCSPSRISILTGKSPAHLGFTDIPRLESVIRRSHQGRDLIPAVSSKDIASEEITIPELLKQVDDRYATAHFGKWHIGGGGPGEHGFDRHDGDTDNRIAKNSDATNPKDMAGITKRTVDFITQQTKAGVPFFVQISHYAVHLKAESYPETRERIALRAPGERHRNVDYAAMTEDLDGSLGVILEAIDRLDIAEQTYVVYTSDNGATLKDGVTNNAPLARGKTTVFEGGIRVPLLVRGPGIAPNSKSSEPVIAWDLLPTFLELAGGEDLPNGAEGGSFASLLQEEGQGQIERATEGLVWHFPHYRSESSKHYRHLGRHTAPQSAIRVGNAKLVKSYESGEVTLFDLTADLGETTDLSGARRDETAALKNRLESYLLDVDAKLPATVARPNSTRE